MKEGETMNTVSPIVLLNLVFKPHPYSTGGTSNWKS